MATLTARFVEAVAGTGAAILDTRKTTPGLRELEKAAVARRRRPQPPHGPLRRDPDQGEPHRPRRQPRQGGPRAPAPRTPTSPVEVECRNLDEVAYALGTGADILLLDNMDLETLRGAVRLRDENAGAGKGPSLEASGGVDLETVRGIAETGVDFISVGALTHSAPTLDFSHADSSLP